MKNKLLLELIIFFVFTLNCYSQFDNSSKRIILLKKNNSDSLNVLFSQVLSSNGFQFIELTALQINDTILNNSIIIGGFCTEPTEFTVHASKFSNAINSGSWFISESYGNYILKYAGIGNVNIRMWDPVAFDKASQ